jgi:hypothetical protein
MERARYSNNETVPIGFPNTDSAIVLAADTASSAFGADVVVRVTPTAGAVWVAIGTAPTATADTNGNHYVDAAQDLGISSGNKIIATGAIQVTPFK